MDLPFVMMIRSNGIYIPQVYYDDDEDIEVMNNNCTVFSRYIKTHGDK